MPTHYKNIGKMWNNFIEVQLFSPILLLAQISPCSNKKGENCKILLPFGVSILALRDFISSLECSRYSNLKMIAIAFSLLSTLNMILAGICLLNARCTFTTVFTSVLKLLNRSRFVFVNLYHGDWWGYLLMIRLMKIWGKD